MAVDLSGGGGGGGRGGRVRPAMNVTPLVDVVLVLLIIFMVVTPLLAKQFWLHLPPKDDEAKVQPPPSEPTPPVVITVTAAGVAKLNSEVVADAELPARLRRVFAARKDRVLFFDANDDAPYGRAMQVLDLARGGGALTIAVSPSSLKVD